jgi:hypothetical protein
MLRIGSIRWRGKCPRHPGFDPHFDGRGAIRGGCERCSLLADIQALHTEMLGMMRKFTPPRSDRRPAAANHNLQTNLFEEL